MLRYLSFLPGFDVALLLANEPKATRRLHLAAHEHHDFYRMQLTNAMDQLEILEKPGVLDAAVREAILKIAGSLDLQVKDSMGQVVLKKLALSGSMY